MTKTNHTALGKVTADALFHIPATTYGRQPVGRLTRNTHNITLASRLFASQLSPADMAAGFYRLQLFK